MLNAETLPAGPASAARRAPPSLKLALARYRYVAVFDQDLVLPVHAGSLLRSVFGLALRRTACMTGSSDCKTCPLYRSCAYPAIFETPPRETQFDQHFSQVPNPFVIQAPPMGTVRVPAGEPLQWHHVLIGRDALHQLPLVTHAWDRSLRTGWGSQRVRGRLVKLAAVDAQGSATALWEEDGQQLLPHDTLLQIPSQLQTSGGLIHLDFHSPLRMQHEGRPMRPDDLRPRKLVADLLRRCSLMMELHLGLTHAPFDAPSLVARAALLSDDRSALRWRADSRYSSRQRQETPLGGVLGRWSLMGDRALLTQLLPWFWLGQWLHLGKNTTMGLGSYSLVISQ